MLYGITLERDFQPKYLMHLSRHISVCITNSNTARRSAIIQALWYKFLFAIEFVCTELQLHTFQRILCKVLLKKNLLHKVYTDVNDASFHRSINFTFPLSFFNFLSWYTYADLQAWICVPPIRLSALVNKTPVTFVILDTNIQQIKTDLPADLWKQH